MQEDGYPLNPSAAAKSKSRLGVPDRLIKVPAFGLSLLVQLMLEGERDRARAAEAELARLRAQYEGEGGGKEEMEA